MKDALGHGSNSTGNAALDRVNRAFRLQSHTHEVVSPTGEVVARLPHRQEQRGRCWLHDAFAMAAYRAKGGNFSAESVPLHYLTGKDFAGHTIREAPAANGKRKYTTGGY